MDDRTITLLNTTFSKLKITMTIYYSTNSPTRKETWDEGTEKNRVVWTLKIYAKSIKGFPQNPVQRMIRIQFGKPECHYYIALCGIRSDSQTEALEKKK